MCDVLQGVSAVQSDGGQLLLLPRWHLGTDP